MGKLELADILSGWGCPPGHVAKIAIEVRKQKLFKDKYKSFTAWVNAIANKCDHNPTLIWRYIKAGRVYLDSIESDDIDEIDRAKAAPEVLVNLEKVQRHAPSDIFVNLKDKVLAGEVTVKESREIEQTYRPKRSQSQSQSQSQSESPKGTSETLSLTKSESSIGGETSEAVTPIEAAAVGTAAAAANNIAKVLMFTVADWSKTCAKMRYPPRFSQAHTEVRINHQKKRLRLDLVGVVRWSFKKPKDIFVVEIKSSLHDFKSDRKWSNYSHGVTTNSKRFIE